MKKKAALLSGIMMMAAALATSCGALHGAAEQKRAKESAAVQETAEADEKEKTALKQKEIGKETIEASAPEIITGWYEENAQRFYNDENGNKILGWQKIDGEWFAFDEDGAMRTDWYDENGIWYFLGDDGIMRHDTWVDNYYLNSDGNTGETDALRAYGHVLSDYYFGYRGSLDDDYVMTAWNPQTNSYDYRYLLADANGDGVRDLFVWSEVYNSEDIFYLEGIYTWCNGQLVTAYDGAETQELGIGAGYAYRTMRTRFVTEGLLFYEGRVAAPNAFNISALQNDGSWLEVDYATVRIDGGFVCGSGGYDVSEERAWEMLADVEAKYPVIDVLSQKPLTPENLKKDTNMIVSGIQIKGIDYTVLFEAKKRELASEAENYNYQNDCYGDDARAWEYQETDLDHDGVPELLATMYLMHHQSYGRLYVVSDGRLVDVMENCVDPDDYNFWIEDGLLYTGGGRRMGDETCSYRLQGTSLILIRKEVWAPIEDANGTILGRHFRVYDGNGTLIEERDEFDN